MLFYRGVGRKKERRRFVVHIWNWPSTKTKIWKFPPKQNVLAASVYTTRRLTIRSILFEKRNHKTCGIWQPIAMRKKCVASFDFRTVLHHSCRPSNNKRWGRLSAEMLEKERGLAGIQNFVGWPSKKTTTTWRYTSHLLRCRNQFTQPIITKLFMQFDYMGSRPIQNIPWEQSQSKRRICGGWICVTHVHIQTAFSWMCCRF